MFDEVRKEVISGSIDQTWVSYIITRQDMTPEQQLVQTAHATCVLGNALIECSPHELTFVVIGCDDLEALNTWRELLDNQGMVYEIFYEPDMKNQPTSIALYPENLSRRERRNSFMGRSITLNFDAERVRCAELALTIFGEDMTETLDKIDATLAA